MKNGYLSLFFSELKILMEPVFYLTLIGFCCITILTIYCYIKLINSLQPRYTEI